MDRIYANSAHGLVWLGEDNNFAADAKASINAVVSEVHRETDELNVLLRVLYDETGARKYSNACLEIDLNLNAMVSFYASTWFKRLWIVQEAALPRSSTCYCGDIEISLAHVLLCASWVVFKGSVTPQIRDLKAIDFDGLFFASGIWEMADVEHGPYSHWQLAVQELLRRYKDMSAYESRDHVYAFLGLYRRMFQNIPTQLTPDYRKPLQDVFREATRYAIEESDILDTLFQVYRDPQNPTDCHTWPTWVPHWHRRSEQEHKILTDTANASEGKKLELLSLMPVNEFVLSVRGILVDYVQAIVPTLSTEALTLDDVKKIAVNFRSVLQASSSTPDALIEELVAMTICTGEDTLGQRGNSSYAIESLQSFQHHQRQNTRPPRSDGDSSETMAYHLWSRAQLTCNHHNFFVTRKGCAGVGSQLTEPGDVIAVLYGCEQPAILRPLHETGHYEMLGLAYVHGIMDGEAVRALEVNGNGDDVFHIH
ncbi:hypothetical protein LTR97_009931 [Elasticomyces elasticus]|uniref:Heterokaryon incompatibility domain-containing protein n=1 Tax=Elasticomyces elasticus TaxID=574655 RepID=A0AAN7VN36_9PEZI|nr:hypothetical protein LTR97_009931 [Elasticomyces elasticus]